MPNINTIMGKYKGSKLISKDPDPKCAESAQENVKSRKYLKDNKIQSNADLKKSAVSTTVVDGKSYFACNAPSKLEGKDIPKRFAPSMPAADAPDGITFCRSNTPREYYRGPSKDPSQHSRRSGHSETSVLRALAGELSGKTVTMNISWMTNKGTQEFNYPCTDCFNMMCDAAEDCNASFKLCAENGQTVDMKEACDTDKPGRSTTPLDPKRKREGYNELKKVMNYLRD